MRKLGLLIWPLAALIGVVMITVAAPTHRSTTTIEGSTASSLLPS